ncbi:protein GRAVITROPIC IN THE LIGHT 1 [Pistacia vera]|uniref:protein GRAVITROPIC IN THE LIGHT 1 n=1 Tax=Pistacia vera TaxID=55513 RepID=UPI001263AB9A|nr:protein GRAVITROPIC IN THE LIGHT 1 [Pistacia vera]
MECATITRPSKPPSNISEIVCKFAKVCRIRSIGVFYSEISNHHNPNNINVSMTMSEDGSDNKVEETECGGVKVHPQPIEVRCKSNECGDMEIMKLFEIVSKLKLAYVQLQEAHIPYDPEKIKAADELVVAELEALCKTKRMYKEKQLTKVKFDSSCSDVLKAEIEVNEKILQKLKSQVEVKESEIFHLQQELQDLHLRNAIMADKITQQSLETNNVRVLDVKMFEDSFKAASKSIHEFAKPVISLMKASGWNLDLAATSIEAAVAYSKRCHKKYAFEAYIARRMFHGMSLHSYNVHDIMKFDDPFVYLVHKPDSDFAKFCRKKYLLVVHPMMEASFFGNLDQRVFVSSGKNPRTPFYQIFVKMAKWIWILQGIASSIDPKAKIFVVNKGCEFSNVCMESVEELSEGTAGNGEEQTSCKVEFMVMPGFRIGDTLVKSQVYISRMN